MTACAQQAYRPPVAGASAKRLWLAAFALAAGLYLATAQHGPAWRDSGMYQWRMRVLDMNGFLGVALAHPLVMLVGHFLGLLPIGGELWRYNAGSALAMAAATANLALLARRIVPGVPSAAWFAAGAFALAHTTWWLATITESQALLAALMTGELLALLSLLRRPRLSMAALLGLLNGLGASTHDMALLALPAYGLTVLVLAARRQVRWWAVAAFILAWCVGAAIILTLTVQVACQKGVMAATASALFGSSWKGNVLGFSVRAVAMGLGYVVYNFLNLSLPLAAVGLWRLKRIAGARLAAVLTYLLLVHFAFAIRYTVADQFKFFLPVYVIVTLLAGIGLAALVERGRRWLIPAALATLVVGPVAYAVTPAVLRRLNVEVPGGRVPLRDNARYWLTPWKQDEDSAGQFARQALAQLQSAGQKAYLYAAVTPYWPLHWTKFVEECPSGNVTLLGGRNKDLIVAAEADPAVLWGRLQEENATLWTVSPGSGYCPDALLPYLDGQPTGLLYRVRPPEAPRLPPQAPLAAAPAASASARE